MHYGPMFSAIYPKDKRMSLLKCMMFHPAPCNPFRRLTCLTAHAQIVSAIDLSETNETLFSYETSSSSYE